MRIIVQKFGGTSVATAEARRRAAERVVQACREGYMPVVVVSAMGRRGEPYATDTLIDLARQVKEDVPPRELDLLISCGEIISAVVMVQTLRAMGYEAVALTGGQAGIYTDGNYGNAKIKRIDPRPILAKLQEGKIVVVAGFQGIGEDGNITTLGRGGSDTTATALGGALQAELVEIYTDVDGVMTTDPRLLPEARILSAVTYREVCEMANQGAKVIHPRAVEMAMAKNVPIKVRNTFSDAEGTLIAAEIPERVITGLAHINDLTQVTVKLNGGEDTRRVQVMVFSLLAEAGINVDMINVNPGEIFFVVRDEEAEKALTLLREKGLTASGQRGCAKLSVIGAGMQEVPGVMARLMEALDGAGIDVLQTSDSDITISFLIKQEDLRRAVEVLHRKFDLHKD